jgi:hypothetical protein
MGMEISWRPHALVSALHAAEAVSRKQPLVDEQLAAAIEQPARQLAADIRAAQLPASRLWSHLVPLTANLAGRRQAVETAVMKTIGRGLRVAAVAATLDASLAGVDAAVRAALPNLNEELPLRTRPLREQWEARGPGMLREIGRLTEEALIAPSCEVLPVYPALGGAGEAHLSYNSVRIEAVLANPVAELPEAVRLAWLIAQLQIDLPAHSESIHADRLPHIARYAMLPPALIAADAVGLIHFAPSALALAVNSWNLAVPPGVDAAALLSEWWQTYVEARPPWHVALAALDQLLG